MDSGRLLVYDLLYLKYWNKNKKENTHFSFQTKGHYRMPEFYSWRQYVLVPLWYTAMLKTSGDSAWCYKNQEILKHAHAHIMIHQVRLGQDKVVDLLC